MTGSLEINQRSAIYYHIYLAHDRVNYKILPNTVTILRLMLLILVTAVSVERANSAPKFEKTDRRSTMMEERLNALLLLLVHKDINVDLDKIVIKHKAKEEDALPIPRQNDTRI